MKKEEKIENRGKKEKEKEKKRFLPLVKDRKGGKREEGERDKGGEREKGRKR